MTVFADGSVHRNMMAAFLVAELFQMVVAVGAVNSFGATALSFAP